MLVASKNTNIGAIPVKRLASPLAEPAGGGAAVVVSLGVDVLVVVVVLVLVAVVATAAVGVLLLGVDVQPLGPQPVGRTSNRKHAKRIDFNVGNAESDS